MQFDLSQLQNLLTTLNQTDISELTLRVENFELVVRRNTPIAQGGSDGVALVKQEAIVLEQPQTIVLTEVVTPPVAKPTAPTMPPGKKENIVEITSPMVGTYYSAPAPGEAPFVTVGDSVKEGQTVCIIEAMKLMNELEAEVSGQVREILVENGQPVEFNQPLIRIAR